MTIFNNYKITLNNAIVPEKRLGDSDKPVWRAPVAIYVPDRADFHNQSLSGKELRAESRRYLAELKEGDYSWAVPLNGPISWLKHPIRTLRTYLGIRRALKGENPVFANTNDHVSQKLNHKLSLIDPATKAKLKKALADDGRLADLDGDAKKALIKAIKGEITEEKYIQTLLDTGIRLEENGTSYRLATHADKEIERNANSWWDKGMGLFPNAPDGVKRRINQALVTDMKAPTQQAIGSLLEYINTFDEDHILRLFVKAVKEGEAPEYIESLKHSIISYSVRDEEFQSREAQVNLLHANIPGFARADESQNESVGAEEPAARQSAMSDVVDVLQRRVADLSTEDAGQGAGASATEETAAFGEAAKAPADSGDAATEPRSERSAPPGAAETFLGDGAPTTGADDRARLAVDGMRGQVSQEVISAAQARLKELDEATLMRAILAIGASLQSDTVDFAPIGESDKPTQEAIKDALLASGFDVREATPDSSFQTDLETLPEKQRGPAQLSQAKRKLEAALRRKPMILESPVRPGKLRNDLIRSFTPGKNSPSAEPHPLLASLKTGTFTYAELLKQLVSQRESGMHQGGVAGVTTTESTQQKIDAVQEFLNNKVSAGDVEQVLREAAHLARQQNGQFLLPEEQSLPVSIIEQLAALKQALEPVKGDSTSVYLRSIQQVTDWFDGKGDHIENIRQPIRDLVDGLPRLIQELSKPAVTTEGATVAVSETNVELLQQLQGIVGSDAWKALVGARKAYPNL